MIRVTVSFPDDQHAWLAAEAKRSGLTMGSMLRAMVDAAQRQGWTFEPQPGARIKAGQ